MNTKTSLLFSICIWTAASSCCFAATMPSGTTLIVRTVNSISSHQRVGRTVKLEIDQDVVINGKVVLRAGTAASGIVETSVGDVRRSNALTVNLTSVSVNEKTVPVKTTGAHEPQLAGTHKTRRGGSVYVRDYTFPHNTRMAFQLAQPLNL
jgi:hypothetical protein